MMGAVVVACLGVTAGLMLMRRFPAVRPDLYAGDLPSVSVIIPARNEAHNLGLLLASVPSWCEVLVVDDGSTDGTAQIAAAYGIRTISAGAAPSGWVGKSWACQNGAAVASGELLLFMDADTRFKRGGLERILSAALSQSGVSALSVLPYHRTEKLWESLSLFFHLLMAFGAAGFSRVRSPRLLGPFLLLRNDLYWRVGGHAAVKNQALEHLSFAGEIERCGGRAVALNSGGTLWTRMYPGGLRELCKGWSKAFVAGAGRTPVAVLALSSLWLAGGASVFVLLFVARGWLEVFALTGYALFAVQIAYGARQIGSYSWLNSVLYPIPLFFYFGLFTYALARKTLGNKMMWKGRRV